MATVHSGKKISSFLWVTKLVLCLWGCYTHMCDANHNTAFVHLTNKSHWEPTLSLSQTQQTRGWRYFFAECTKPTRSKSVSADEWMFQVRQGRPVCQGVFLTECFMSPWFSVLIWLTAYHYEQTLPHAHQRLKRRSCLVLDTEKHPKTWMHLYMQHLPFILWWIICCWWQWRWWICFPMCVCRWDMCFHCTDLPSPKNILHHTNWPREHTMFFLTSCGSTIQHRNV